MNESLVRVDDDILKALKKLHPEFSILPNTTLVKVILKKYLHEKEKMEVS